MSEKIPIIFRINNNQEINILHVPASYTGPQLVVELLKAFDLELLDPSGKLNIYVLQHNNQSQALPPFTSLVEAGVLRGDYLSLIKAYSVTDRTIFRLFEDINTEVNQDQDSSDYAAYVKGNLRNQALASKVVGYWREALLYQAAMLPDKALEPLLLVWDALNQQEQEREQLARPKKLSAMLIDSSSNKPTPKPTTSQPEQLKLIEEIKQTFLSAITQQVSDTNTENLSRLLDNPVALNFFQVQSDWKNELVENILSYSNTLAGKHQRYYESVMLAELAAKIQPQNERSRLLIKLGMDYLELLRFPEDSQQRLVLARSINTRNPDYGNIKQELSRILELMENH